MNIGKILENIEQSCRFGDMYSLPLYTKKSDRVYWFNYYIKNLGSEMREGIGEVKIVDKCYVESVYSCNLNGREIEELADRDNGISSELNFEDYDEEKVISEKEYYKKLQNVNDNAELIALIKNTDEITYIGLYEKVIDMFLNK